MDHSLAVIDKALLGDYASVSGYFVPFYSDIHVQTDCHIFNVLENNVILTSIVFLFGWLSSP